MPISITTFKKVCRVITPIIGLGDGFYLISIFSDQYWLSLIGFKYLFISVLLTLFSVCAFLSALISFFVKKESRIVLTVNLYNLSSLLTFFFALAMLYISSYKSIDESLYWIDVNNQTLYMIEEQNISDILTNVTVRININSVASNFFNEYQSSDEIDAFVRGHTVIPHDVVLLTFLIWALIFVLFNFFSPIVLKYSDLFTEDDNRSYKLIQQPIVENEDKNIEETPKPEKRSSFKHVKSAAKLLRLVKIEEAPSNQIKQSDIENVHSNFEITDISSREGRSSDEYSYSSDGFNGSNMISRRSKSPIPKRMRRSHLDETKNDDSDLALPTETINLSVSPSPRGSNKQSPLSQHSIASIPPRLRPLNQTRQTGYQWDKPIRISMPSSSSDSTSELFYSYSSSGFFDGFHSSDSW